MSMPGLNLLDDLRAEVKQSQAGPPCKICEVVNMTPPGSAARAELASLLTPGTISDRGLIRALKKNGVTIGPRATRRHREEDHRP